MQTKPVLIRGGRVHDAVHPEPQAVDILLQDGAQHVLLNGEEIVWVVGRRIDDRYKITAKTENILKLRCEEL